MEPRKRKALPLSRVFIFFLIISLCGVKALSEGPHHAKPNEGSPVVEKDQRKTLLVNEFGEITAINLTEGHKELPYHLQFITLEPNSLFLPVLLHADMVFYVHTGSGKLTWADYGNTKTISLRAGDVCSLNEGSVFYIQSNLESERRKLRIYAMFTNTEDNTYDPSIGAYSRINELIKGFDKKIMQAALKVPEDLIEAIYKSNTSAIVHAVSEKRNIVQELEASFLKNFLGDEPNSKKPKTYNIFDHNPDFKTDNGWSTTVTKKKLKSLKHTNIGFLMVHLSLGSILGPHWNRMATELSVAVEGEGMVRAICGSSNDNETECQNMRIKVKEGDAFVVPKFHPMAQMSFENESFVFLGFSTSARRNRPQFLAGKQSVLHVLDKQILAESLGVSNITVDQLLRSPENSVIFGCSSCAEEEEKLMKEEEEKKREEEEARKKEEEERKRKQEEEAARKEEEERKREEEEVKRQKEETRRKQEEEEAKREKEEEKEEEEAEREEQREREKKRKREEEIAKRQEEEREARREQEKMEKRMQEEEARREAARKEQEQAKREAEESAESEQEQAEREQETRERRRQEETEGAEEHEGRHPASRRGEKEEEETTGTEQEQEQAERQQEQREKRREEEEQRERRDRESDNEHTKREEHSHVISFEGRRVLKMRSV